MESRLLAAAMAAHAKPKCYEHMGDEAWEVVAKQMVEDLERLATNDGCIAAAWALEMLWEMWDGQLRIGYILQKLQEAVDRGAVDPMPIHVLPTELYEAMTAKLKEKHPTEEEAACSPE